MPNLSAAKLQEMLNAAAAQAETEDRAKRNLNHGALFVSDDNEAGYVFDGPLDVDGVAHRMWVYRVDSANEAAPTYSVSIALKRETAK